MMANITNMMNSRQKLLAVKVMLPVVADLMEDLIGNKMFRHEIKQKSNILIKLIREDDSAFYDKLQLDHDPELKEGVINEITNGEIALRQFLDSLTESARDTSEEA